MPYIYVAYSSILTLPALPGIHNIKLYDIKVLQKNYLSYLSTTSPTPGLRGHSSQAHVKLAAYPNTTSPMSGLRGHTPQAHANLTARFNIASPSRGYEENPSSSPCSDTHFRVDFFILIHCFLV